MAILIWKWAPRRFPTVLQPPHSLSPASVHQKNVCCTWWVWSWHVTKRTFIHSDLVRSIWGNPAVFLAIYLQWILLARGFGCNEIFATCHSFDSTASHVRWNFGKLRYWVSRRLRRERQSNSGCSHLSPECSPQRCFLFALACSNNMIDMCLCDAMLGIHIFLDEQCCGGCMV